MKKRMLAGAAAALCCAGAAWGQSANDLCANAIPVTVDSPVAGAVDAADNNDSPTTTVTTNGCGTTFLGTTRKSVYYSFVPATNGYYEFSLCTATGTTLSDSRMAIWAATDVTPGSVAPCSGTVAALACNDDSCGLRSNFNVNLAAGTGYIIQVAPFSTSATAAGTFVLLVHGPQSTPAPANDDCGSPVALTSLVPVNGDLTNATGTSTTIYTCGSTSTTGNDVWYTVTPAVAGTSSIEVCGNFDTIVNVLTAAATCAAPASLACNDDTIPTGCTTHGSRVTFTGVAGTTYLVRVAGVRGSGTADSVNPYAPAHGEFTVLFTEPQPSGTCCNNTTGACTFVTQSACGTAGTWTLGGACSPSPCPPNGACCVGSCCTVLLASVCATNGGAYQGDGSVCTTNPCPAPANDLCANAIPVTAGVPVSGDNCNATSTNDGPAASCQSSGGKGVWYSFASPGGLFDIGTCGSNQDTVLTVFTSDDCVTFTQVSGGCDDDTCDGVNPPGSGAASFINNLDLPAGNYLIRVSSFGSSPAGNTFTLLVGTVPTGACCDTLTGLCSLAEPGACPSGTTYQGDGTVCDPNPCVQPMGACCLPNGTCQSGSGSDCASAGGLFQGDGSACNSVIDPCPGPAGACCNNTTGVCTYVAGSTACASGNTYSGDGSVCSPNSCPQPGACCTGTTCTSVASTGCAGDFLGVGVVCDTSTCTIGACCIASTGTCIQTNATLCANQGGEYSGDGTVCSNVSVGSTLFSSGGTFPVAIPDSTPAGTTATISVPSGSGTVSGLSVSIGLTHTWVGDLIVTLTNGSTTVTLVNRPGVSGTSTFGFSSDLGGVYTFSDAASTAFVTAAATTPVAPGVYKPASVLSAFDGAPFEGTWTLTVSDNAGGDTGTINGLDFVSVQVTPTCQFTGACCCGSSCSATLAAECAGTNQVFMGSGTVCNVAGNYTSPCCQADYNHVGGITVQDIFDFLAGYFGGNPCADINGGGISVQDIFDFLAAYFSGGC